MSIEFVAYLIIPYQALLLVRGLFFDVLIRGVVEFRHGIKVATDLKLGRLVLLDSNKGLAERELALSIPSPTNISCAGSSRATTN